MARHVARRTRAAIVSERLGRTEEAVVKRVHLFKTQVGPGSTKLLMLMRILGLDLEVASRRGCAFLYSLLGI